MGNIDPTSQRANPTTTAHCAIAAPALTLITCVIHAPDTRRSREGGNLESLPRFGVGAGSRTRPKVCVDAIPKPPNDNCPLRHRRASPYIGCMRHSRETPVVPAKAENLASLPPVPSRKAGIQEGEGSDDRKRNEMEQNGTELKVYRSYALLRAVPLPGMALPSACSSGSLRRPREGGETSLLP